MNENLNAPEPSQDHLHDASEGPPRDPPSEPNAAEVHTSDETPQQHTDTTSDTPQFDTENCPSIAVRAFYPKPPSANQLRQLAKSIAICLASSIVRKPGIPHCLGRFDRRTRRVATPVASSTTHPLRISTIRHSPCCPKEAAMADDPLKRGHRTGLVSAQAKTTKYAIGLKNSASRPSSSRRPSGRSETRRKRSRRS